MWKIKRAIDHINKRKETRKARNWKTDAPLKTITRLQSLFAHFLTESRHREIEIPKFSRAFRSRHATRSKRTWSRILSDLIHKYGRHMKFTFGIIPEASLGWVRVIDKQFLAIILKISNFSFPWSHSRSFTQLLGKAAVLRRFSCPLALPISINGMRNSRWSCCARIESVQGCRWSFVCKSNLSAHPTKAPRDTWLLDGDNL